MERERWMQWKLRYSRQLALGKANHGEHWRVNAASKMESHLLQSAPEI